MMRLAQAAVFHGLHEARRFDMFSLDGDLQLEQRDLDHSNGPTNRVQPVARTLCKPFNASKAPRSIGLIINAIYFLAGRSKRLHFFINASSTDDPCNIVTQKADRHASGIINFLEIRSLNYCGNLAVVGGILNYKGVFALHIEAHEVVFDGIVCRLRSVYLQQSSPQKFKALQRVNFLRFGILLPQQVRGNNRGDQSQDARRQSLVPLEPEFGAAIGPFFFNRCNASGPVIHCGKKCRRDCRRHEHRHDETDWPPVFSPYHIPGSHPRPPRADNRRAQDSLQVAT
ncbi:hypothetical protein CHELA1G11_12885 [Hyphomicrobiales bacterium]|nr:hypothetical protein CHELA1G2_11423 [Hyphomicrobiales bacterium]CAH1667801.1 hypothetical protein CHELA1G11_12885 [Hyphomicrobiales bacterium]